MNLEELRSVQRAERQKDSLQHLRDSFYEDVADYLAGLKEKRQRAAAAAEDPFASEEVRRLSDEYQSAKEISNALYERRVGKVVKHASFAAADMETDEDGMTVEERDLFDDLVERIRANRRTVLARLEGEATEGGARTEPTSDSTVDVEAESTSEPETAPASPVADQSTDDGATTADSPDVAGEAGTSSTAPDDDLLADALGDAVAADENEPASAPTDEQPAAGTAAVSDGHSDPSAADSPATGAADPAAESRPTSNRPDNRPSGSGNVQPADTTPDAGTPSADPGATPDADTTPDGGTPATERTTVRITADVGTVYGVDEREYDLAREDVVMLPTTNAEPLLQKNAAERIDFD